MAMAPPQYMPEIPIEEMQPGDRLIAAGPPIGPTFPQLSAGGGGQVPGTPPPVESYTPEQQAQIATVLEMIKTAGAQAQQAAIPPSQNSVMQDISKTMQGQLTPAPPQMPFKGVHDRYQPYIDDLAQQGMALGHGQDHMAMQPGQPIRNLVRGLAIGLDSYAQAKSRTWEQQWGGKGYASRRQQQLDNAAENYIKELAQKANILSTLADLEAREQQGYAQNMAGAETGSDIARKNALAPFDAYQKYQQGETRGAQADQRMALTDPLVNLAKERAQTQDSLQGKYGAQTTDINARSKPNVLKIEQQTATSKSQEDLNKTRKTGEESENISKAAKAEFAQRLEAAKTKLAEIKANAPPKGSAAEKPYVADLDMSIKDAQKFITDYDVKIRDAGDQEDRETFQKEKEGWIKHKENLVAERGKRTAKTTTGGETLAKEAPTDLRDRIIQRYKDQHQGQMPDDVTIQNALKKLGH